MLWQVCWLPLLEEATCILDEEVVDIAVIIIDLADVRNGLGRCLIRRFLLSHVLHKLGLPLLDAGFTATIYVCLLLFEIVDQVGRVKEIVCFLLLASRLLTFTVTASLLRGEVRRCVRSRGISPD